MMILSVCPFLYFTFVLKDGQLTVACPLEKEGVSKELKKVALKSPTLVSISDHG
jgi:hypothetical protein